MKITTARRSFSTLHLLINLLFAYAALADVFVSPYDPVAVPFNHVRAVGLSPGGPGGGGGGRGPPGTGGRMPPGTGNPGTGRKPPNDSKPDKIALKDLPPSAHIDDTAESKPFNVGNYRNKPVQERILFNSFQGPDRAFFLKMMDIFGTTDGYFPTGTEDIYEGLPAQQQRPFDKGERPSGRPMQIRPDMAKAEGPNNKGINFDPRPASAACGAFLSLYTYCLDNGDPDMDCACYSSTYYVPDQFNGMASRCAKATATGCRQGSNDNKGGDDWCDVGKTVAAYTNYCTADDGDVAVKFGARIKGDPTPTVAQPGSKSTTRNATPTENDDDGAPPRQTTPAAQRSTTGQTDATSTPRITPTPSSRPIVLSFIPSPARSTTSFSGAASRPWDILAAGMKMWIAFGLSVLITFA